MKFLGAAVATAFALRVSVVGAQQLSIADLTSCGLTCLLETIPQAGCTIADKDCQCGSTILPQITSECLLANCTMHDSLVVSKVTASVCEYPHPDRSNSPITVTAAVVAVTSAFIILRFISKGWVSGTLALEDWIIATALLLSFGSAYFTVKMCKQGFGKHIWDLQDGDLAKILENFYISENIYVIDLALSKISILVFYLRIFPHEWFRYGAFATIAMITISTIVIFLMTVFSCQPVAFFWDRDLEGQCLNINAIAYANSGLSIAQDLTIVALPIPVLLKLNMGMKKKIGVSFMFAIGSFGCVISMIRLKTLVDFGNSIDPTWDYVDTVTWTVLELAVAMICACLPAIRNLLIRLYPSTFLTSMRTSTTPNKSGSRAWNSRSGKHAAPPGGLPNGEFMELDESALKVDESGKVVMVKAKSRPIQISDEYWQEVERQQTPLSSV